MKTKARRDNKQKCLFDNTVVSTTLNHRNTPDVVEKSKADVERSRKTATKETLKQLSIRLRDEALKEKENNP